MTRSPLPVIPSRRIDASLRLTVCVVATVAARRVCETRSRCNGRARHGGSSWFQMQSLKSLSVARNLLTDSSAPAIVATLTALTALAELSLEANNVRVHLSARHGMARHCATSLCFRCCGRMPTGPEAFGADFSSVLPRQKA